MDVLARNNVRVAGSGDTTLVFLHGFGCDQNMWRLLAPAYARRCTVVTLDLVGSGGSDLSAYDFDRYSTLEPELAIELTNSFCRTDPEIARHFARVTFLSDHRADVARLAASTLVVPCHDDLIAPQSVGEFLARTLPNATLRVIDNVGHCPHLSSPGACAAAVDEFLATIGG